jgi:beta-xylosidase
VELAAGRLTLASNGERLDDFAAAVLAVKTTTGDYLATTRLQPGALKKGVSAGLSAFGDSENALGLSVRDGKAILWRRQRNKHEIVTTNAVINSSAVWLRMTATAGHKFQFASSPDGKTWTAVGENIDLEGNYLPPWDRGVRIALTAGGANATATFNSLRVESGAPPTGSK